MSLKNLKTLGKWQENLQPKMPELEFFKKLFFPRLFKKLQNWVKFNIFSYLQFFPDSIIYGSIIYRYIIYIYVRKWRLFLVLSVNK